MLQDELSKVKGNEDVFRFSLVKPLDDSIVPIDVGSILSDRCSRGIARETAKKFRTAVPPAKTLDSRCWDAGAARTDPATVLYEYCCPHTDIAIGAAVRMDRMDMH